LQLRSTLCPYTTLFRSLSTAIAMMFIAGGIVYLNVTQGWQRFIRVWGWPFTARTTFERGEYPKLHPLGITLDIVVAAAIFFAMGDRKSTRLNSSHRTIS